jgi:hypothetical protein
MDHPPWTIVLFLALLYSTGPVFGQVRDSLNMTGVTTIEELYQDHLKDQERKDGNMIRSGLAVAGVGVLLVTIFNKEREGLDRDESVGLVQTGLVLSIVGAGALGRGIYLRMGEGSTKKKKDFFMRYGAIANCKGYGRGQGFAAAGMNFNF